MFSVTRNSREGTEKRFYHCLEIKKSKSSKNSSVGTAGAISLKRNRGRRRPVSTRQKCQKKKISGKKGRPKASSSEKQNPGVRGERTEGENNAAKRHARGNAQKSENRSEISVKEYEADAEVGKGKRPEGAFQVKEPLIQSSRP